MKLHREIQHSQTLNAILAESTGPIPYECILDGIITQKKSGEQLDVFETFAVANLIWFFSSGRTNTGAQMNGIVNIESNATSVEASDMVKAITSEYMTKLATELLFLVKMGNNVIPFGGNLTGMTPNEWVSYVLKRQD